MTEANPVSPNAMLPNGSVAVVVYNLKHAKESATFTAHVSPADYTHADAMLQPYPGKRGIPQAESLRFTDTGGGLYRAERPVGQARKIVRTTR